MRRVVVLSALLLVIAPVLAAPAPLPKRDRPGAIPELIAFQGEWESALIVQYTCTNLVRVAAARPTIRGYRIDFAGMTDPILDATATFRLGPVRSRDVTLFSASGTRRGVYTIRGTLLIVRLSKPGSDEPPDARQPRAGDVEIELHRELRSPQCVGASDRRPRGRCDHASSRRAIRLAPHRG